MTDDRLFDLAYSFAAAFECDACPRRMVDHAVGEALGQMFEPAGRTDAAAFNDALKWSEKNGGPFSRFEESVFRTAFFGVIAICRAADPQKEPR